VAQGAAKYAETPMGKQLLHLAAFSTDPDGASRALAIVKYLGGSKSLQVFCKGRLETNVRQISIILECYLNASMCKDFKAHCRKVIGDPFSETDAFGLQYRIRLGQVDANPKPIVVQRYLFPCTFLEPHFRFQKGHPAKIVDQIEATAINNHCDWCPLFNANSFSALPKKILMPDGTEIFEGS
jgi:hypothetical protein